ncbi:MerR family transcriptional regulator [Paenibacillus senegalensis]|uniref:MerR family transcriptional regulator n=1 Tax=Paenibacillus senegalensis TaxID=1465766 RepID=UPI00028A09B4
MNNSYIMKIKEVADRLSISTRSIRFYEAKGLISPQKQENNDYRIFTEKDIWRLQTILSLREAGMSIEDIRKALPVVEQEDREQLQSYLELQRAVLFSNWLEIKQLINTTDSIIDLLKQNETVPLNDIFALANTSKTAREARKNWTDQWDFDQQAGTHDERVVIGNGEYRDYGQALETTVEWVAAKSGERGLDVGTGTGNLAGKLLGLGVRMAGIDQSIEMLKQCQRKHPQMETKLGNVLAIPYVDGQFDFIVTSFAFHHISEEQKVIALEEMRRVLKPHGRICMTDVMFETPQQKEAYLEELTNQEGREAAERSRNEHYAYLSTLLQWFDEQGYITKYKAINERLFTVLAVPIR